MIAIGIGGFVGAILRYAFGLLILSQLILEFPLTTLLINWLGSFVLGWFTFSFIYKSISTFIREGISVGLIGSFTTYSTFSLEVIQLIEADRWLFAMGYIFFSLWGGLFCVWLGERLANKMNEKACV